MTKIVGATLGSPAEAQKVNEAFATYGRSKSDKKIKAQQAAGILQVPGLDLKPEELAGRAAALSNRLPSIELLERFDLKDYSPILRVDAETYDYFRRPPQTVHQ